MLPCDGTSPGHFIFSKGCVCARNRCSCRFPSCRGIITPIDILYERFLSSYRHSIGARRVERNQANLLQGTLDLLRGQTACGPTSKRRFAICCTRNRSSVSSTTRLRATSLL